MDWAPAPPAAGRAAPGTSTDAPATDTEAAAAIVEELAALAQGEGTFLDRARRLADETDSPHVREMTDFILSASDRSFLTPK